MTEDSVVRFILSKVQIKINESRHQERFARSHRQTKQIIRITYAIEDFLDYLYKVDLIDVIENVLLKLGQTRFAIRFQSCEFE